MAVTPGYPLTTLFPPFERWCEEVLHPYDTQPWNFRTQAFYDEYRVKYAIARLIRPNRILEVGVRFGYSARSFLFAAPKASYVGIDFDEPSFGSYDGIPRLWAEQRLKFCYPDNTIQTFKLDTQKDSLPVAGLFDLVHVDADHSYAGALHDLQMFWPLCGNTMVVDDYVEVASSVVTFLEKHLNEAVVLKLDSLRGSALLIRTKSVGEHGLKPTKPRA
jgi:hypothetical protein